MDREEAKAAVQEIVGLLQDADVPKEMWPTVFENLWRDMKPGADRNGSGAAASTDPTSDAFAELARRANGSRCSNGGGIVCSTASTRLDAARR